MSLGIQVPKGYHLPGELRHSPFLFLMESLHNDVILVNGAVTRTAGSLEAIMDFCLPISTILQCQKNCGWPATRRVKSVAMSGVKLTEPHGAQTLYLAPTAPLHQPRCWQESLKYILN